MKNIFNDADRREIQDRVAQVRPDSKRLWGTMAPDKMICHCGDQLRLGLGEIDVPKVNSPMGLPGVGTLAIFLMPWPKGVKTAPQLLATDPESLETDKERLRDLIERVAAYPASGPWGVHPLFGKISGNAWGRLAWRHLDHHLRQFSC